MSVNSGSATPPARLLARGALTEIATGSSSSTNLAMSMSCTAVSVIAIVALKWPGENALRWMLWNISGAPIAPFWTVSFIARYCASKRRMNPIWTSRLPKAASASRIAEQSASVVAIGFSQKTGIPPLIAATT